MESIKPSFDVLLQTGLHRGLHSRYLKKRRPHASKSLHEGIDRAGRHGHDRGHGAGKDITESRYPADWHARPSTIAQALVGDSEGIDRAGRRGHDRGHGAGKVDVTESRYPADWHARPSTVAQALVGDSEKLKSYDRELDRGVRLMANFRELSPAPHKSGDTFTMKGDASGDGLSAIVMRATRLSTDDLGDISSGRRALLRSSDYRYYPGSAVISVDELPRPQRGTYLVETVERPIFDDDSTWSTATAGSSVGPHRPISLHGDELMTYMQDAESAPNQFTLDSLLGSREKYRQHQQSVGASSANVYTEDDEISNLHRFLDNPFTGHSPRQQVCLHCVNHGYADYLRILSI